MNSKQQQVSDESLQRSMAELMANPNFGRFIDTLREQREVVIDDLCSDEVAKNERATLAAIGELRTYKSVLSLYDDFADRRISETESQ